MSDIKVLLQQYGDIQKEIVMLNKKLNELQFDKVSGSDSAFPYTRRSFNISGVAVDKQEKYNRMLAKAEKMEAEVLDWIEEIPDSLTRTVFVYRYIDSMSWFQISNKLNYSESYLRISVHKKYLDELE